MSELLFDRAGRRRSPATTPGFHIGRPPRNKGLRYPADPPKVEEIVAVMRGAGDGAHGRRLRLIVILWRAGLRIQEALSLAEADLDHRRGALLVRRGKGGRRREVGMDHWGWTELHPWLELRVELPVVCCSASSMVRRVDATGPAPPPERTCAGPPSGGRAPMLRAASLSRPDRYADPREKSAARRVRARRVSAYSELLENSGACRGSVAAGFGVERFGAVDRLLLVGHVGVEVDVGGRDLLVAEP